MRRSIVAGNWKMHGSRESVHNFVVTLEAELMPAEVALVVFPPVGYLSAFAEQLAASKLTGRVALGAQDLHVAASGAYTGETSGAMIRDLGGGWVIVGHSERRSYAAESNELVADKFAAALAADLTPILCVGETAAERESGSAETVVAAQLEAVARRVGTEGMALGAVAYEPIWAIGTGRTATPELAQAMHASIRDQLGAALDGTDAAAEVSILYGGSVKSSNASELFAAADIDGGLVGGASLDAVEFAAIARAT